MKVLLLGATGRTGKHILTNLISNGYLVTAVVRKPEAVKISSPLLSVMQGDVLDEQILQLAMTGCDAVISALNVSRKNDFPWAPLRTPKNFVSSVIRAVVRLARSNGLRRVIVLSAWGVGNTRKALPWWFRWTISHSNILYPYIDLERQEEILMASNLNWTSIRPVGLTNGRGKQVKVTITPNEKPSSIIISRKSVAEFLVEVLQSNSYIQQSPTISD